MAVCVWLRNITLLPDEQAALVLDEGQRPSVEEVTIDAGLMVCEQPQRDRFSTLRSSFLHSILPPHPQPFSPAEPVEKGARVSCVDPDVRAGGRVNDGTGGMLNQIQQGRIERIKVTRALFIFVVL
jgi:hypothetical protein